MVLYMHMAISSYVFDGSPPQNVDVVQVEMGLRCNTKVVSSALQGCLLLHRQHQRPIITLTLPSMIPEAMLCCPSIMFFTNLSSRVEDYTHHCANATSSSLEVCIN